MSDASVLLNAVATGALGLIVTVIVGTALNEWFHFYAKREMNGGLAALFMGAVGGIAFFIFGCVVGNLVANQPEASFLRAAVISCGSVLALGAAVLLVGRLCADLPPKLDGDEIELAIELRAPAGYALPRQADESTTVAGVRPVDGHVQQYGSLKLHRAKQIDGRWTILADVPLRTSAAKKVMVVQLGPDNQVTFPLPLRAHPHRRDMEWSDWLDANAASTTSALENRFSVRFRVRSARRTHAEIVAEQAADEQARFDLLGAHTPIVDLLPHTRSDTVPGRVAAAVKHIVSRPGYADEIAALMVGNKDEAAIMALELAAKLPPPQTALLPHVAAAGRDIARQIREANANAEVGDAYPYGIDRAVVRFQAWLLAANALRRTSGGDFTPELGEILELCRQRPETLLLQENVRGVASQTMQGWANVEPQPGDLPAR